MLVCSGKFAATTCNVLQLVWGTMSIWMVCCLSLELQLFRDISDIRRSVLLFALFENTPHIGCPRRSPWSSSLDLSCLVVSPWWYETALHAIPGGTVSFQIYHLSGNAVWSSPLLEENLSDKDQCMIVLPQCRYNVCSDTLQDSCI